MTPQAAPKRSQGGSHEWLWVAASSSHGLWGTAPAAHVSPAALRCGQREHGAGRHRPQRPPWATPAPWGDPSEPGGPGHHPPNLGFAPRVAPAPLSAAGPARRVEGGGWQPSGRARGGSSQLRGIKGDKRGHGGGRGAAMRRRKGGSGRPRWGRGGPGSARTYRAGRRRLPPGPGAGGERGAELLPGGWARRGSAGLSSALCGRARCRKSAGPVPARRVALATRARSGPRPPCLPRCREGAVGSPQGVLATGSPPEIVPEGFHGKSLKAGGGRSAPASPGEEPGPAAAGPGASPPESVPSRGLQTQQHPH